MPSNQIAQHTNTAAALIIRCLNITLNLTHECKNIRIGNLMCSPE
ncbi:hypothetical protein [Stenoxybacter acetivorans]|nr:hypothetical protein [Stenoxybacter acetivorans]